MKKHVKLRFKTFHSLLMQCIIYQFQCNSTCFSVFGDICHDSQSNPGHSLRVELVERAVHSDSDAELLKASVQSDLVHHGRQTGSTQLRRTLGHHAAHLLHQNTVITRAADQAQVLQDGAHLPQSQTITATHSTHSSVITQLMHHKQGFVSPQTGYKHVKNMPMFAGGPRLEMFPL